MGLRQGAQRAVLAPVSLLGHRPDLPAEKNRMKGPSLSALSSHI